MMIQIPLKAVAFVIYTVALLAGAFGISYAVFEWRDDGAGASEYIECVNDANLWDREQAAELRANMPEGPDAPPSWASEATFDVYQAQFDQYEKDYNRWLDRGIDVAEEYDGKIRACGDLVD